MTFKIKVIKTEDDYKQALSMLEELMDKNPEPESEDGEILNLIATLIKDYEKNIFPDFLPNAIDAIKFRMEQQNLKPKDLVPYIGNSSKVSEILSGKRTLTLSMMRKLQDGLGIPAKVLLGKSDEFQTHGSNVWKNYPIKEMEKRGYFKDININNFTLKELIENFLQPLGSLEYL